MRRVVGIGRALMLLTIGRALALLGIAPTKIIITNLVGWMEM